MLIGQPMFKGALLSLLHAKPEEEGEGEEEKSEGTSGSYHSTVLGAEEGDCHTCQVMCHGEAWLWHRYYIKFIRPYLITW